jgi:hypothetical protein
MRDHFPRKGSRQDDGRGHDFAKEGAARGEGAPATTGPGAPGSERAGAPGFRDAAAAGVPDPAGRLSCLHLRAGSPITNSSERS